MMNGEGYGFILWLLCWYKNQKEHVLEAIHDSEPVNVEIQIYITHHL